MNNTIFFLLSASLSDQTKKAYARAWRHLKDYLEEEATVHPLPLSVDCIMGFIGHLYNLRYAPATITSSVSAISFVHRLLGLRDPGEVPLVKQMLQGCRRLTGSHDRRLPITAFLLEKILQAAEQSISCPFTQARFAAMCSLAFCCFTKAGRNDDFSQ